MCNKLSAIILMLGIGHIVGGNLKITVFYETLCPDSKRFIEMELFPTYKSIGNYMTLELVPFGNAEFTNESGKLVFTCQHGERECYGNKMQSCALALFPITQSIEFIYCVMKSEDPASDVYMQLCATTINISWVTLKTCYTSGQADKLLEKNGIRTLNFRPPITFVPAVAFNDYYNATLQNDADKNLKDLVCKLLNYEPVPCNEINNGKSEYVKLVPVY